MHFIAGWDSCGVHAFKLSEAFWTCAREAEMIAPQSVNSSTLSPSLFQIYPSRLTRLYSPFSAPRRKRLGRDQLVRLSLCNSRLIENSSLISRPFHYERHLHSWGLSLIYLFRLLIGITLWMTSSGSHYSLDFSCFADENGNDLPQRPDRNIRLRESSNKCHGQRQTGRQTWRQRENYRFLLRMRTHNSNTPTQLCTHKQSPPRLSHMHMCARTHTQQIRKADLLVVKC